MKKKLIMIASVAAVGSALVVSAPAQAQRFGPGLGVGLPSARSQRAQRRVPSMDRTRTTAEDRTTDTDRFITAAGVAIRRRIMAALLRPITAGGAPVTSADIEAGAIDATDPS